MARVLRFDNRVAQSCEPLFHDVGNAVAHWTRATVELRRSGGKAASTTTHTALHLREPDVAEFPETQQTLGRLERRFDDFADEDRARGFNRRYLQIFLEPK